MVILLQLKLLGPECVLEQMDLGSTITVFFVKLQVTKSVQHCALLVATHFFQDIKLVPSDRPNSKHWNCASLHGAWVWPDISLIIASWVQLYHRQLEFGLMSLPEQKLQFHSHIPAQWDIFYVTLLVCHFFSFPPLAISVKQNLTPLRSSPVSAIQFILRCYKLRCVTSQFCPCH